jgi:YHS domain-containing protein
MRTIIVLCLVLMIALSFGCSKKKEEAPKTDATQTEAVQPGGEQAATTLDPVSKEVVDIATSTYSFEFNGIMYHFSSAENMEAFKADPAKYLAPDEMPPAAPQGQ